jgi:glutamate carboxypeptidase
VSERWTRVARSLAAGAALLCAPAADALAQAQLSADEIELRVLIEERQPELERTLENWVNQNTGSFNLEGLRGFAAVLQAELVQLGFEVRAEPGPRISLPGQPEFESGPLVLATRRGAEAQASALRLLLMGHYDTVFEPEVPFQRFTREGTAPGRALGPGVTDMKGGLLVMLAALRGLRESGALERAHVTVLLNGDEELGSLGSRPRIESVAREADIGFVFESAQQGGAMVRSRGGLGQFHLSVNGVAAHAGSAHQQGRSAIRELAGKVLAVEALTDYGRGLTLNVGTIRGGSKRNIVPEQAEAWIDLRYANPADGESARAALERIAAQNSVPETRSALWGSLHRPPKLADARTDALLEAHAQVARAFGMQLPEPVSSGGGTDGSLTAAVGLATLDSLGVVGGEAHTDQEYIELRSLGERAALAAALLGRLIRTHPTQAADGAQPAAGSAPGAAPAQSAAETQPRSRGAQAQPEESAGETPVQSASDAEPRHGAQAEPSGDPAPAPAQTGRGTDSGGAPDGNRPAPPAGQREPGESPLRSLGRAVDSAR